MKPLPIMAVILDCDGTLVDSEKLSMQVLVDLMSEFGLQVSHDVAMQRFAGADIQVVFQDLEKQLGKPLPSDLLATFRTRQFESIKKHLQPIPGAGQLVKELRLPFCVASNAPRNKISLCLESTGLDQHIREDQVFSAYDVQRWKPNPDLFLAAASSLNVPPQHCAVVEDSVSGIKAGIAAGMQVFAFNPHGTLAKTFSDIEYYSHLDDIAVRLSSSIE